VGLWDVGAWHIYSKGYSECHRIGYECDYGKVNT
jgi:hypothetical protein